MADALQIQRDLVIPGAELEEQATGSGGPGGQHANKTDSRVVLRWSIQESVVLTEGRRARLLERLGGRINKAGELVVSADDTRSWHQNRQIARERMAGLIQRALARRRTRRPTKPTRASKRRRLDKKRRRGDLKAKRGRIREP